MRLWRDMSYKARKRVLARGHIPNLMTDQEYADHVGVLT
jgi:hypothetical protein